MKRIVLAIGATFIWVAFTLFLRNEVLLKHYWVNHYNELGLEFPSEPINGVVWMVWSLLFAAAIFILSRRYTLIETALLAWFMGFVLMEIVIGNLGVLPYSILWWAVPMSFLEILGAAWIAKKTAPTANHP